MSRAQVSTSRRIALPAAAILALATSAAAAWDLTAVEDRHGARLSSARFDPAGMPAIAFGTGALVYAEFDGARWTIEIVAPGCDGERGASLAFDPGGKPAISYHDDQGHLLLARSNGMVWSSETIDDTVWVDGATSLAFDPAGNPAIAYHDQTHGDLRYATAGGTTWTVTTVDGASSQVGEYASLAFDDGGLPAISYYDADNRDLKFARFDGTSWQPEVVEGPRDVGMWSSLAFDRVDNPAISYFEGAGDLKYAFRLGTGWSLEYVGSVGISAGTSLAFDAIGSPAIAYWNSTTNGSLELARRDPSGWSVTPVDDFRVGAHPSLDYDPLGNAGISYLDLDNATIKFAQDTGGGFSTVHVAGDGPYGGSVAFDASGNAVVSYSGGTVEGVKFARFDGFTWTAEVVDRGFWLGNATSLTFDGDGLGLLAYDDRSLGNLKLARFNGSTWVPEVVEAGAFDPTAPMAPSVAIDAAGHPAISYRWFAGPGGFELKLARFDGSIWDRRVVVPSVSFEFDLGRALAFDPAGNPAIVYRNAAVTYLHWNGATWDSEVVDAFSGRAPSLAFDGAGNPAVAYTGAGATVTVARRIGGTWQRQPIAGGDAGTIAIDSTGNPAVSYLDSATGEARIARWDGTGWVPETVAAAIGAGALAISGGNTAVVYDSGLGCRGPEVALDLVVPTSTVHRGVVPSLAPGWQTAALPLTSLNDDQTPPFPATVVPPGSFGDASPPSDPLVLYRVLRAGNTNAGNALRVVKGAGGTVALEF